MIPRYSFRLCLLLLAGVLPARAQPAALPDTAFAGLVERLSEPGGYFDTDNLISNEKSYLHVAGVLRQRPRGGVYLGVGPGQNFSYIALTRPDLAFLVDIRRDNLLQHLFYKALFTLAPTRLDYLGLLFARPRPAGDRPPEEYTIDELVAFVDGTRTDEDHYDGARAAVRTAVQGFGVPLSPRDLAVIDAIHVRFIHAGMALRFNTHNQPPRSYYPSFRDLLLERDRDGRQANYLVREDDYRYVRRMERENRLIPVVGDLGGTHALRAIGAYLRQAGGRVSTFYTSNVEFYLMRQGTFGRFVENVAALPLARDAVIVRSYFNRFTRALPETVPGYASTQLTQAADALVRAYRSGAIRTYHDLILAPPGR